MALILSLLEAIGIGLILPFISILVDPQILSEGDRFAFLKPLIQSGSGNNAALVVGAAILVLFTVKSVAATLLMYWQLTFTFQNEARLSSDLFRRYLEAPVAYHLEHDSSEVIRNTFVSTATMFNGAVIGYPMLLMELGGVFLTVAVLLLVDPRAALITFLMLGAGAGTLYLLNRRRMLEIGKLRQDLQQQLLKTMRESVGGLSEIRLLGREAFFEDKFDRARMAFARSGRTNAFITVSNRQFLEALLGLTIGAVTVLLFASDRGAYSIGVLGVYAAAGIRLMPAFSRVLNFSQQIRVAMSAVDIVDETINRLNDNIFEGIKRRTPRANRLSTNFQFLEMRGVCFSYSSRAAVLNQISMTLKKGESVGLIGPTGSGKSTLVSIMLGLLEPSRGKIFVNSSDREENLALFRSDIGYVPQTIFLLDETIRRNIAFGLPDELVEDHKVERAVVAAQLFDLVKRLPAGLETTVGERGVRLSGGERQRIGIARALYEDPEVLILDEATSSLDASTEFALTQTIESLQGTKTLIIIAHRLSTIKSCDRLIYLEDGRIVAEGTYEDLLTSEQKFRRLVDLSAVRTHEPAGA